MHSLLSYNNLKPVTTLNDFIGAIYGAEIIRSGVT